MRHPILCSTLLTLTLLGTACAPIQPATNTAGDVSPTATAAHTEEHAAHGSMMSEEPFDATFIDGMIVHHQGAIEMAKVALVEAEHAELRTLAEGIVAAQESEIEQMQGWRSAWYPDLDATAGMMMDMGQMTISDDASVPFDQRFLEAMISHHQGALAMAKMALDNAEHAEIRTLAEAIIAAQEAEIAQMQGWLAEWYGVRQ